MQEPGKSTREAAVPLRIGIDVGGTKIAAVALAGSDELVRRRVDTPRHDYEATIRAIRDLVADLERVADRPATVGVGIPGTVSRETGLVKNANSTWLIGRPFRVDLAVALGRDVRIANDANCFSISEATDGAAAGVDTVFGVIVGTGTGAGIVIRGQVIEGRHGIAGEWGHNPLPWPETAEWPGPACYCGRTGCIETFLSGPGLAADHARHGAAALDAAAIVAAADSGEPAALATLERYAGRMARALAAVINVLDPDVIVLGGGLSNVTRVYDRVPALWAPYVFACGSGEVVRTRLVRAAHGDASGVRGAARLWDVEAWRE